MTRIPCWVVRAAMVLHGEEGLCAMPEPAAIASGKSRSQGGARANETILTDWRRSDAQLDIGRPPLRRGILLMTRLFHYMTFYNTGTKFSCCSASIGMFRSLKPSFSSLAGNCPLPLRKAINPVQ